MRPARAAAGGGPRAIDLGDLPVAAVTVSRSGIASLDVGASVDEVRALLRQRASSRNPVTEGAEENRLGHVMARELHAQLLAGQVDLRAALRKVPFFPEQTPAVAVLRALQASRTHIGVVVDELGSVTGLVAVEDLAEEVLGEVFAERETPSLVLQPDGPDVFLVLGTAPVHEIYRELGSDPPAGPGPSRFAGLLLHQERAVPAAGARIALPGGLEAEVVEATKQRIRRVRLGTPARPSDGAAGPWGSTRPIALGPAEGARCRSRPAVVDSWPPPRFSQATPGGRGRIAKASGCPSAAGTRAWDPEEPRAGPRR